MNDSSFFELLSTRLQDRLNDPDLLAALSHLDAHSILFVSEGADANQQVAVHLHTRGIELSRETGESQSVWKSDSHALIVSGPTETWLTLLSGELSWVESTNATLGSLRVAGDPVVGAWLMPPLSRFFSTSSLDPRHPHPFGNHADTSSIVGRYVGVNGVQAYFESAGKGVPVLLLHTAGRDNRQWHPVMARLSATHRVYSPDLPGHGKSWPLSPKPCLEEIHEIANWLLDFMTAVGEERFMVAGTSVGGNLALLLPALSSRVLGSVAFQGADFTPTISQASLELMRHSRVSLQHSSMDQALSLIGERAVPEARAIIEWSIRELSPPAQRGDLTAYTNTDTRRLMPDVRCPVTLVHGDCDWLATRAMVDQAASRITNSAKLKVVTLPGIGHYPHVEDPDAATALIEEMGLLVGSIV